MARQKQSKQESLDQVRGSWVLAPVLSTRNHERGDGVVMKVLIADDCADAAESLSELLRIYGHEVRCADNGLEALTIAREFRPGAAILDIGTPRLDGFEVALQLRAMLPSVALIAATGWPKCSAYEQEQRRFDHYLLKPAPVEDLLALLELSARPDASSKQERRPHPKASDQERQSSMGSPQAAGDVGPRRRRAAANVS
jgi:CheY-like chemotaxis protein